MPSLKFLLQLFFYFFTVCLATVHPHNDTTGTKEHLTSKDNSANNRLTTTEPVVAYGYRDQEPNEYAAVLHPFGDAIKVFARPEGSIPPYLIKGQNVPPAADQVVAGSATRPAPSQSVSGSNGQQHRRRSYRRTMPGGHRKNKSGRPVNPPSGSSKIFLILMTIALMSIVVGACLYIVVSVALLADHMEMYKD